MAPGPALPVEDGFPQATLWGHPGEGEGETPHTRLHQNFDFGYFVTTFGYTKSKPCGFLM